MMSWSIMKSYTDIKVKILFKVFINWLENKGILRDWDVETSVWQIKAVLVG